MKIVNKIFVVLVFICPLFSFAQESKKIDSLLRLVEIQEDTILIKTYRELFIATITKEPKKSKPYLDAALKQIKKVKSKKFEALLTKDQGVYYYYTSDYAQAKRLYEKAISLFEQLNDEGQLSAIYNNLGIIQKYMGLPEKSLESHLKSLRLKEKLGKHGMSLAASYLNIGVLHGELGNLETSNDYYRKAEAICLKENQEWHLSMVRSNLAINMEKEGKIDEALAYYFKSIPYFEKNGYQIELAKQYNLIGALYLDLDSLELAKDYFSRSLELSKDKGELQMVGLSTGNLGDIYYKEKKYKQALKNFQEALNISKEASTDTRRVKDYLNLANAYAALNDFKKAYDYRVLHFEMHNTIFKQENIKKLNELEIQYQTEKKEQQIVLQEKEITVLEQEAKINNQQRLILGGGLGFLLLVFGFGFYGIRQKMKRNKLERERVDAELAFKKKELTTHALHLAKKNEVLESVKQKAKALRANEGASGYQELIKTINFDQQDDKNWESFTQYFEQVHKDFSANVKSKYPNVTKNELRFMALLKMNMSSKEIATILNISPDGIKKARQRLRKKMDLTPEESLENTVLHI
ncbi:tetratricopeptide repeat protein [Eudoraea sp.]|uniref:tetratricopeptide repeat protein n=1 Tax=Eudoraea sp. TaxID=1979955 RepID=UPI003C7880D4